MVKPLNVLIVDDYEDNAALILRELSHDRFETHYRRVETTQQMFNALDEKQWDVILADYAALKLEGPGDFKLIFERIPDIPIIVFSGKVDEKIAVELLQGGARDFMLKSNMARLNCVIERELCEVEARRERHQAVEKLKESEKAYRDLLENINDVVYSLDRNGIITYCSPGLQRTFGEDPKDYIGHSFKDFIYSEDSAMVSERFVGTLNNILRPEEFRIVLTDGRIRWVRTYGHPVIDDSKVIGVSGVMVDITERKEAEERIRHHAEQYNAMLATTPDGFWRFDKDARPLDVNDAYCRMIGYSREELLNMRAQDIEAKDNPDEIARHIKKIRENGFDRFDAQHRRKDGTVIDVELSASFWKAAGQFLLFVRDITERKEVEKKIVESNARYLELFHSVIEGIALVDENEAIGICNSAFAKIFDFEKPADIAGKNVLDFMPDKQKEIALHQTSLRKQGKSSIYDLDIITIKGNAKTINVSASPRFDRDGNFAGSFSAIFDITDRKQAEQALRENEEKYRSLVEMFPHAITIFQDGKTVFANQSSADIFGIEDVNVIIGRDFLEPVAEHDKTRVKEYMDRCIAGDHAVPNSSQIDLLRADGSKFPVEVYANRIIYNGRPACQVMAIDITERRKAEQALRENEEKYRSLVEMFPHAIAIFQDHKTVFANQSAVGFFGVKNIDEILNHHSFEPVPAHERERLSEYMARRMSGDPSNPESYHVELMRADGTLFPAEIYANSIIYNGRPASQVLAIDITERKKAEEDIRRSEERYRTIVETASEGIWMIDPEAKTTFVNKQMAEMLGYTLEEMLDMPLSSFMDSSGIKVAEKALEHRHQGIKETYENKFIHKNGTAIDVNISASPLFDADNLYAGALAMITEITQRKRHEFRAAARSSLLYDLHSAATITDCMQMGCQAILKAGLYKRALFILYDIGNTADIAHIGLRKSEIQAISNAAPPDEYLMGKFMDEKHRISRSYFIPYDACDTAQRTWLQLAPEIRVDGKQITASKDSSLVVPVLGGNGANKGCLLIAAPDGKPDEDIVKFIEEIVEIVLTRVREVRNEIQIAENNRRLEEKNLALKEVMGMIETEKEEIRQQTAKIIDQTIKPILNRLVRRNGMVNRPHYELIKTALDELALATGGTMQIAARLSPRELEICSLIKGGASSKDIAETLDISVLTVQKHREVIRRKLGLTNRNINLTTHLRNL